MEISRIESLPHPFFEERQPAGSPRSSGPGRPARRLLLLALPALLLCGCSGPEKRAAAPAPGYPLYFSDDAGRVVTLPGPPQRIISLAPAHTETLFALGAGDRVVAVDNYSREPAQAASLPQIRSWPEPSLEAIAALRPDLVVALTQEREFLEKLARLKIPAVKLFPESYPQSLLGIRRLGTLVDRRAEAEKLAAGIDREIAAIRSRVAGRPRPRFLLELDASDAARPYVAGGRGLYSDLLEAAGGRNVFDEARTPALQVSTEQIVSRSPEVVLLADSRSPVQPQQVDSVARRAGWSSIAAVKKGRIYTINDQALTRPGPRMPQAVRQAAELFHPGIEL